MTTTVETLTFQAETTQLLDLMIHSLYSHREIFLRELISNASDALDRLRFAAVSEPDLLPEGWEPEITLSIDKEQRILTIRDNGIGMSRAEVVENIGTIAKSGTREMWERMKKSGDSESPEQLIGQFGVGFYSGFMVASQMEVITRRAGEDGATKWASKGDGTYTLEAAERDHVGTSVIVHLREADKEASLDDFTDSDVLRRVVKKYSDFVRHPIKLSGDTLNSMKALWRKAKSDVTDDEYKEFYQHITGDWTPPLSWISLRAEGVLEYHALLYIPSRAPFDLFYPSFETGLQLYVKSIKIMDYCAELLPRYLRFVRGLVDSSDLPLNVSREILQNHGQIRQVKKGVTKKVLDSLRSMLTDERDRYLTFWEQFGGILKEGISEDDKNKDKLSKLLLFFSSNDPEKRTTLAEYVERMKEGQKEIYYITGEERSVVANSPQLEAFKAKGLEILYLIDPIDEFLVQWLTEFDGHPLVSTTKGTVELGTDEEKKAAEKALEEQEKEFSGVLNRFQKRLSEKVKEVRLSTRLTDSPVCLVGGENDMSPQLEKLLQQGNMKIPKQLRIMELNPEHAICQHMKAVYRKNSQDPQLDDFADLLLGQALLAEGSLPPDPGHFTKLVSSLMVRTSGPS